MAGWGYVGVIPCSALSCQSVFFPPSGVIQQMLPLVPDRPSMGIIAAWFWRPRPVFLPEGCCCLAGWGLTPVAGCDRWFSANRSSAAAVLF